MSKHSKMKFYPRNQGYESFERWKTLSPKNNGYSVRDIKELSGLLPKGFLDKSNCVVIMRASYSGSVVFVANFHRVDPNFSGSQIDQNPYIVAFSPNTSSCYGGFIHDGNWTNRTITVTDIDLWKIVSGSRVLDCLPIEELPGKPLGDLYELKVSHNEALNTSVELLLKNIQGKENK